LGALVRDSSIGYFGFNVCCFPFLPNAKEVRFLLKLSC